MHTSSPHKRHRSLADAALSGALNLSGVARQERLGELSARYPEHAPVWVALAEEHLVCRRREDACECARRALALDPSIERTFSPLLASAYGSAPASAFAQLPGFDAPAPNLRAASHWLAPAPPAQPALASYGESFGDVPAIDLPDLGTARPSERTRFAPNPLRQKPFRPLSRPMPAYLRDDAGRAPSQAAHNPNVDRLLKRALDTPQRTQRLNSLRELSTVAPDHPSVLFNLAMQLVIAEHYDEARRVGDELQEVDLDRYRQLYYWAEEWVRAVPPGTETDFVGAATVSYRPDSQRLQSAQSPASWPMQPVVPVPSQQPMHFLAGRLSTGNPAGSLPGNLARAHKTQLLAVPVPPLRRVPRATPNALAPGARARHRRAPSAPVAPSRLRTAGALIAGVCAGLLVAMALVFALGGSSSQNSDTGASKASSVKKIAKPKTVNADRPDRPDRSVVHSATSKAKTR